VPTLAATALRNTPALSVAVCPSGSVFVGDSAKVTEYQDGTAVRWEWVTDLPAAAGGVYDGPALDMVCDSQSYLVVATPVCLNVRRPDGAVDRFDFDSGMPMNNSNLLTLDSNKEGVWVGTPQGLLRWSRGQGARITLYVLVNPCQALSRSCFCCR
jgi:ligand-binding sensor domain-containing protein